MKQIRCKAIVILRNENKFLFTDCFEKTTNQVFYIPVGGGVEFGERSIDAAKREAKEETGEEIENLELLNIVENIFEFNGFDEHEVVFIYRAEFKNKEAYTSPLKGGLNAESKAIKLVWADLDEIEQKDIRLYPEGLFELLKNNSCKG